ncbi:hypothetical protein CLD22_09710 [Rubrivivax gelatinosus]|nr:hypothetical protein [Rubrivivax gelatinosus]
MNTMTPTERAVREVRQAAFELNATDHKQALRMLHEALKLQPGHADLLGDLAALHLQAGRHRQCIQAAREALAANPEHDDSAFALALSLEAVGEAEEARELFLELTEGARAERFAAQPELVDLCRSKLLQIEAAGAARPASAAADPAEQADATPKVYVPLLTRPDSLGQLLDETEGVRALTLDCFDTILWRHTDHPTDVFYDMQRRPAFKAAGIDATMRQKGEFFARQLQLVRTGRTEVTLEQIYLAARPGLSREMLAWLAEDELAAEMNACHALPGAVRLLREARTRGLPVTIVSDTYFDAPRLRRLLEHALPADASAAIGEIVVSCEHGMCKEQGLFKLAQLNLLGNSPAILHVGDNKAADFTAPRAVAMSATHLLHENEQGQQRRRMAANVVALFDPSVRQQRPLHMPYRPVHASHSHQSSTPQASIGHDSLGPLMHAFAAWIDEEAAALAATRSQVKLVFLMRDAHLPLQTYREIGGGCSAYSAHISRFSAYAASFRTQEDVDQYLAHFSRNLSLPMIARQLLLSPQRTALLVGQAEASTAPLQTFLRGVRQANVLEEIVAASTAHRERLRRYLERETGMQPGDTLVLVDLGYAGTIQRVLGPTFSQDWKVEVLGRYLLAVGAVDEGFKGLLDRSWLDERALKIVQTYIGLLETLTSTDGASTVGYADDGSPVFETDSAQDGQSAMVEPIQAESLRFAREAQAYFRAARRLPPATVLRDEALGSLGRLLFFPNAMELAHLANFTLEINLGSGVARKLFDLDAGLEGLRRHGLFYMRSAHGGGRMALPAELRAAGLELSTAMLAHARFGMPMVQTDWSTRSEPLLAVIPRGDRTMHAEIVATATHDGYFSALVPLPNGEGNVGLAFGRDHGWIQLHSAEIVPLAAMTEEADVMAQLLHAGVKDHGHGLLEFEGTDSLLMLPAGANPIAGKAALRLVFRPIARRA